jgi:hypothetical protein
MNRIPAAGRDVRETPMLVADCHDNIRVSAISGLAGGDYGDRMERQSGAFGQLQLCVWLPV